MNLPIGEIAALLAAFSFSITSIFYTLAGRKVNTVVALATSLPISWIVIVVLHQITLGEPFPFSATIDRWVYLSTSGILAFVISSYFILNSYQHIGPRLTMLVASFAPVLGAILAWIFLGQTLPANSTIGITLVLLGIIWVVLDRNPSPTQKIPGNMRTGVILAVLGTLAQGLAFVFSSQGVSGGFPPFSATLIRTTAGIVALWVVIVFQGNIRSTVTVFKDDPKTFLQICGAAIAGPVIAGSLLLLSFQYVAVGVSTTLSHTTSIMLIPMSYIVFKERISLRAVLGTIVAIIGIAILFI